MVWQNLPPCPLPLLALWAALTYTSPPVGLGRTRGTSAETYFKSERIVKNLSTIWAKNLQLPRNLLLEIILVQNIVKLLVFV